MSKPSRLLAVAVLLALGVACGLYLQGSAVAQDKEKPKEKVEAAVAKWEYRVVLMFPNADESIKELNKLGDEGFEIAFVTGGHQGVGARQNGVFVYTLKRAKK